MEKIRVYMNTRIPDCQTWLEVSLSSLLFPYVQFSQELGRYREEEEPNSGVFVLPQLRLSRF